MTQVEKEDRQKQKAGERQDCILGVSGGDKGGYEFVARGEEFVARGEELFLLPQGAFVVCPQQVAIVNTRIYMYIYMHISVHTYVSRGGHCSRSKRCEEV